MNLLRWTSARSIKETFVPADQPQLPHMEAEMGVFELVARPAIMAVSRSVGCSKGATRGCSNPDVVHRFVPGETVGDALESIRLVSIDYLGEDVTEPAAGRPPGPEAYLTLLDALNLT